MSKEEKNCKKHDCKCNGKKSDSKEKCKCHDEKDSCRCDCGCHDENGKCTCGCQDENGKCSCGCHDKDGKCNCKCSDYESKIELLEKQVEESKKLASQYLSTASYYKSQAEDNKKDFERFKERNKNIEQEANSKANENVAKKLLPVLDNFDQAMTHVTDAEILKGFAMIYSSLVSALSDIGVVEIVCKNEVLNPELHNCISTEETDDENLNEHIATVYQKGYMFAESKKVVRPATVSVYKVQA